MNQKLLEETGHLVGYVHTKSGRVQTEWFDWSLPADTWPGHPRVGIQEVGTWEEGRDLVLGITGVLRTRRGAIPTLDPLEVLLRRALIASTFAVERARRFAERTEKSKHGKKKKKQPRSKAVTGWVLAQAVDENGQPRCERCLSTHWLGEPIFRQGHHVLDFATFPERDDIWNVIALCGNCHDNCHQGPNAENFNAANASILASRPPSTEAAA